MINGRPLEEEIKRIDDYFDNLSIEEFRNIIKENMRDATDEELDGVENYIKSISMETGVNFYDDINSVK